MDILAWTTARTWICVRRNSLLPVMLAALLASCGGDSGIDLGSGQDPDPVVVDYPLFYVKRPLPVDNAGMLVQTDAREILPVEFGADLYMRARASVSAPETNLTGSITNGFGDVRDVSVSHDGEQVLFAMRTPIDPAADDEDQPTWNIWEYDIPSGTLRRVVADDITADEGHDIAPQYLPDGRILFSSTRQNQSVAKLLDQSKPQFPALDEDRNEPAFVLHVMSSDGTDLEQVSFNQSHDLWPSVLDDGRILFSRWDNGGTQNGIHLYTANPDGSDLQLLYGADSHATGTNGSEVQFLKPREMSDGRILAILAPFSGTSGGGDLITIDVADYINDTQPNAANRGILTGPGQEAATNFVVSTVPGPSVGGRFASAWPLWDGTNRAFVSWAGCLLEVIDPLADPAADPLTLPCTDENLANPLAVEADPTYGIWIYDFFDDTQVAIVVGETGSMYTDVAVAQPRAMPGVIPDVADGGADPVLLSENVGILHIHSVYDMNGLDTAPGGYAVLADPAQTTADQRPARFLRLVKAVGIPDEEVRDFAATAFGRFPIQGMREIVGYAPIEPDGSIRIKVPADTPIAVNVLDRNGRRIFSRHQNWLQVRPGEVKECNGCHMPATDESHGRADGYDLVNLGAQSAPLQFPNTDPALYTEPGETMAETRTRISCLDDCAVLTPSADLVYEDVWTWEPDAGRAPDMPFSYAYADIDNPEVNVPVPADCVPWTANCRVIINYEEHIQTLWDASRPVIDPVTLLEIGNDRCIDCHAERDPMGELVDPDDRGQLDLRGIASNDEPDHFISYRELLFGDFLEEIRDGAIQEVQQYVGDDPVTGDPIFQPVPISPPMTGASANLSPRFFTIFETGGSHVGRLSPAELRLVSEWLDIGAQYYNNPFDAPEN